jgi:hypothetical protein
VGLTEKQRRFAYLVATGLSKTRAYAEAYTSRGNSNTRGKNGCLLAKQPAIAAAIAEYEAQLLPIADVRAEKLNALRSLKSLAFSPNVADKIRLKASIALYETCVECEKAQALPKGQPLDLNHLIERVLEELRRAGGEAKGLVQEESHEGCPLATRET